MKDYDFQAHLSSVLDQILDQMIEQNRAIRKLQRQVMKVKNKPVYVADLQPLSAVSVRLGDYLKGTKRNG